MDAEEAQDIASKQCKLNTTNETWQAILLFLSQRHKNGRFYGASVVCYTCRPEISQKNHPIMIILHAFIYLLTYFGIF